MNTLTHKCCLPDGGGSYDIVNNAVISTPGPQNHRSQNVSLRQSWEMNYQEAAIYLQVFTTRRLLHTFIPFIIPSTLCHIVPDGFYWLMLTYFTFLQFNRVLNIIDEKVSFSRLLD